MKKTGKITKVEYFRRDIMVKSIITIKLRLDAAGTFEIIEFTGTKQELHNDTGVEFHKNGKCDYSKIINKKVEIIFTLLEKKQIGADIHSETYKKNIHILNQ